MTTTPSQPNREALKDRIVSIFRHVFVLSKITPDEEEMAVESVVSAINEYVAQALAEQREGIMHYLHGATREEFEAYSGNIVANKEWNSALQLVMGHLINIASITDQKP